jgi:flagellar hook-length control protein FliK
METFANPCAALPTDSSAYGNWPAGQVVEERQSCFDDVVASVSAKAEASTDKNVGEDTVIAYVAPGGPVGWEGPPNAGFRVGDPESQASPLPSQDLSSSTRQVAPQEDPASSDEGPGGVKDRAGAVPPDRVATSTGAGTAKTAGGKAGGQSPDKASEHGKGDEGAVPIAQAGRGDVTREEGLDVARQLAKGGPQTQSGDKMAVQGRGSGVPSAAQSSRKVHPAVTQKQPRDGGAGRQQAEMGVAQATAKEPRPAGHKGQGGAGPGSPPSSMGQSGTVTWHLSAEAQGRGVAEAGSDASQSPVRNLGEQILDSLQASATQGQKELMIRLQPPELGTVVVRFREQGEHLDGILEVARPETRHQIEQALPEVVRSLQDAGVTIRRLDVINGEPPGQELGSGSSHPDAWSGQYGSDRDRDHFPTSPLTRTQPAGDYSTRPQETPIADRLTIAAHGRIDVLL